MDTGIRDSATLNMLKMKIQHAAIDGLQCDGKHHKQFYLEAILHMTGVNLEALAAKMLNETGKAWEKGIAP